MNRCMTFPLLATLVLGPSRLGSTSGPYVQHQSIEPPPPHNPDPLTVANVWIDGHRHARQDPSLLAPDAVLAIAGLAPIRGRQPVVTFTDAFYGAIGDRQISVEATVAAGTAVSALLRAQGYQTGPLLGVPPTGRPIDVALMGVLDVVQGQITRIRVVLDTFSLLQQLGVLPAMKAPATPT